MKTYRAEGFSSSSIFSNTKTKAFITFSSVVTFSIVMAVFVYTPKTVTPVEAASLNRTSPAAVGYNLNTKDIDERYRPSLQKALEEVLGSFDYADKSLSVSVLSLTDSTYAHTNGDTVYKSASLYKTLAAYRVLQLVERGDYSLKQLVLHKDVPSNTTLQKCIEKAIVVSDNPCGSALQKMSNPTELDGLVRDWGFTNTTISGIYPQTSSNDQVLLYSDIYTGRRISETSKKLLLGYLKDQQINDRVPSVPGAIFSHKTADLEGATHSTAIVTSNSVAYVVSVMSDDWNADTASKYADIQAIHSSVWEGFTKND